VSHSRPSKFAGSGRWPGWVRAVPIAALIVLLVITISAVVLVRLRGPDQHHRRTGAAAHSSSTLAVRRAGPSSARPLRHPPPPPRRAASAPRAARHRDPFGPAATALADGESVIVRAAVYDVRTGQEWELGHGPPQAEASVVKLDILETLLDRYRGVDPAVPAADQPVARQMIEDSDNDAATTLWYAAGGPARIAAFNAAAGLRSTTMSQCVTCAGFPWPGWGLSTTTPADEVALLRQLISPRSLLTSAERRYALRLMERVTSDQRWGVSAGVPAGVTVALKNGWLPLTSADNDWEVNSVGWVDGADRDYLIAVLTTRSPTEAAGISLIGGLSAMIWRAMG
jgi:Beta-lactamase enzyme family